MTKVKNTVDALQLLLENPTIQLLAKPFSVKMVDGSFIFSNSVTSLTVPADIDWDAEPQMLPVTFVEAVKAAKEGHPIECHRTNKITGHETVCHYAVVNGNLLDEDHRQPNVDEILEGLWMVQRLIKHPVKATPPKARPKRKEDKPMTNPQIQILKDEIKELKANIAKGKIFETQGYDCGMMFATTQALVDAREAELKKLEEAENV